MQTSYELIQLESNLLNLSIDKCANSVQILQLHFEVKSYENVQ